MVATLRRVGDIWTIADERRTLHIKDGRGMRLLALLLERPGLELHSLDLVAAVDGGASPSSLGPAGAPQTTGRACLQGSVGPSLDAQARSWDDRLRETERGKREDATGKRRPLWTGWLSLACHHPFGVRGGRTLFI